LHISNVAMEILMAYNVEHNFDLDFALQLALLHDTIEDTATDFDEIKNEIGERIAKGVQALSKNNNILSKDEKTLDSLNRINKLDKEVGMVKLADRITNLQEPPPFWSKVKICKYLEEAKMIEKVLVNKNEFLNTRLKNKIAEYKQYT